VKLNSTELCIVQYRCVYIWCIWYKQIITIIQVTGKISVLFITIQIVTGVEVISEYFLPEVRKMFPRGQSSRGTFYQPRAKNFQ